MSFAKLPCGVKEQETTVSLPRCMPLPQLVFKPFSSPNSHSSRHAPDHSSPNESTMALTPGSLQKLSLECLCVSGQRRVSGRGRALGFKSRVIKSNEAVPPSSASQGSTAPFQIGCPSSAAQITGHRALQANCSDKAVTVVRVQGCRPLGQRLPIKPTEKAAHRACDFYLGRNYPRLFRYLGSSSD